VQQAVVLLALELLVQQQRVQAVELAQKRQLQVQQVVESPEQRPLHLQHRSIQDAHRLEQLYQLRHQLQEEFQQLVKEFQYQPCQ
jgi:hypothetical protein